MPLNCKGFAQQEHENSRSFSLFCKTPFAKTRNRRRFHGPNRTSGRTSPQAAAPPPPPAPAPPLSRRPAAEFAIHGPKPEKAPAQPALPRPLKKPFRRETTRQNARALLS
jgi:hypothetical protein